ncbi:MAG TPA: phosphoribosylformylglycinamidine cyclo-ligase [Patescibacteria group bacterium]|jgi:phosphoribosylformylglycinamidine cyclo-ligase|nr:phosphoribosylformylglycinamidine cyclo-ligase [Patescibacteria group bacterium]
MNDKEKSLSYREAGVDIDAQDEAIRRLRPHVRATHTKEVLADIGTFGGLFHLTPRGFKDPVLVASTDGVGTKLRIAVAAGIHDTVGFDLVSHCVNDILVQGAFPLFFLDYFATGKLEPAIVEAVLSGMARACREAECALIGGELAEMGEMYRPGDYDIAGFIVGAVERDHLITGSDIAPGDILLGLPSVGLHTNGYSLARKIFFERLGLNHDSMVPELGATVAQLLLAPHRSYLAPLKALITRRRLKGLAHITGGGLTDNVPRILPEGCSAVFHRGAITVLPVFRFMQREGRVPDDDMWRTFNMGVGMVLAVAPADLPDVESHLDGLNERFHRIGEVEAGPRRVIYRD